MCVALACLPPISHIPRLGPCCRSSHLARTGTICNDQPIRHSIPCKYWALTICAVLPRYAASICFLFVRPAVCLGLPSDSQSPATPLPLANTSPWLDRALRDAAHPIISSYRAMHPLCERCKNSPSTEVDHVAPEFKVMVAQIIQTLSASQIEEIFSHFDWLDKEPFSLPTGHSALQLLHDAHQTATLQELCKPCHVINGNERRRRTI